LRDDEREAVLTIEPVVRVVVVRVEPPTIIIAVSVEEVEIAVRNVQNVTHTTTLRRFPDLGVESNAAYVMP